MVFLNGDLPVTEIASSARARNVHAVALSILYMEREELLLGALRTLRETLPTDMPLIVGGAALASIAPRMRMQGITFGETLGELRTVLRELSAR